MKKLKKNKTLALLILVMIWCFTFGLLAQTPPTVRVKMHRLRLHGNKKFGDSEIQKWLNLERNQFITELEIYQRCTRVLEKFQQEGHYFAKFDSISFQYAPDSSQVAVDLYLYEGARVVVDSISIVGFTGEFAELSRDFQTKTGKVFRVQDLQEDVEHLIEKYENAGYPYCRVQVDELLFEKGEPPAEIKLTLKIQVVSGELVRLDEIEILGNEQTKPYVIRRELGLKVGEIYRQQKIDDVPSRLLNLGYFQWVNPPKLRWKPQQGMGKLIIELKEGHHNRFDGVIGYNPATANNKGFLTGLIDVSFRNLFGTGREFAIKWQRKTEKTQEFRLQYLEPWVAGLPLNVSVGFEQLIQDTSYVQRILGFRGTLRLSHRLAFYSELWKKDVSPDSSGQILFGISPSNSVNLTLGLSFNTVDHWLNPKSGLKYQSSFEWGRKKVGRRLTDTTEIDESDETHSFSQKMLTVDFEFYLPIFRWQVFALGLHGRQIKSNEEEIAIADQYRFGGSRDLRGYREEQFRGSRIAWTNVEYRYLLNRRSRFFVFFDLGYYFREEIVNNQLLKIEEAKIGYGLGLRLDTRLGYFGIDYGLGQGDGLSNGKIHIRLTNEF